MTRTLAIIPARAGSKRLPRKSLLELGGVPLVVRVLRAALGARTLDVVAVSSDDPLVLAACSGTPDVKLIERPAALATDTSPAIDYVRHTLIELERDAPPFDVVVILQPSSPLTSSPDIDGTVHLLLNSGADTAVSVVKLDHAIHPAKLKVLSGTRLVPYIEEEGGRMATHELPQVYVRNCAVYATHRHVVEQGLIIGEDCRGFEMPRSRSVDINDDVDFALAQVLFEQARAQPAAGTR